MRKIRIPISAKFPLALLAIFALKLFIFNTLIGCSPFEGKAQIITVPAISIIIFSFSFLFFGKSRIIYLVVADILLSSLLGFDLIFISTFKYPPSIYVFLLTDNVRGLAPTIMSLFKPDFIFLFIDFPFILYFLLRKKRKWFFLSFSAKNWFFFCSVGSLLFSPKPLRDILLRGIYPTKAFDPIMSIANYTPPAYHFLDTIYSLKHMDIVLSAEDKNRIEEWFAWERSFDKTIETPLASTGKGKNLIMIQVESLAADLLFQSIEGQELTPNLNTLARNALLFENFYAQNKGGSSSDAEFLALTSIYPPKEGSVFFRYPNHAYHSIPKLLKLEGYTTLAFHGNRGGYWNRMGAYPYLGIDNFFSSDALSAGDTIGFGLSDLDLFKQVSERIDVTKKPFFALVITLSSHSPFDLPGKYRSLIFKNIGNQALSNYFQSIHYTDTAIGFFLQKLQAKGILSNTVVAIYGDHDVLGGAAPRSIYYSGPVLQKTVEGKVPFIIKIPGVRHQKIAAVAGQVDIAPTLASIMGVSSKTYRIPVMGRNLLDTHRSFVVIPKTRECVIGTRVIMRKKDVEMSLDGLDIADLILRGDYFALQ